MSLRAKLIRLAHENPEVRGHILPLLREAALPPAKTWLETQLGNVFTSEAGGHEFWFIPNSVTKSNTAKGPMVTIVWAESSRPSKAKQTSFSERDLSGSHWKVIPTGSVPDAVKARFHEVGVKMASTDHFAVLHQPKGMKPAFEGNVMAVPLDWGGVGVMRPYDVARAMLPLFNSAKNGLAFVIDQNFVFSKPGIPAVCSALEDAIKDQYGEAYAMTSEYFEDALPGSKDFENITRAREQAERANKVQVSISPVVSPTSGKAGLKVVFRPTFEQVEGR